MAGEDLKPFQIDAVMGGAIGGPLGGTAAPAPAQGEEDAGYPTLQEICSKRANFEAFSKQVEATIDRLEAIAVGASGDDKASAEKALSAYNQLSETVGKLVQLTIAEIKQRRAKGG